MSELRGKLVILDFWDIYCIPCWGLKGLDSMQKLFDGTVEIISVTSNRAHQVIQFFKKRKEKHDRLFVTGDTLLRKYFPYSLIPQYVWIDQRGKLLAITPGESLTKENIRKAAEGQKTKFVEKEDLVDFDIDKPLESDELLYRCAITPYKQGLNQMGKGYYHTTTVKNRIDAYNCPISLLYEVALDQHFTNEGRFIIRSKDSARLTFPSGNASMDWRQKNTFCFELIVDSVHADRINPIMVNVLDDYFGLRVNVIEIDTPCLVLRRTSSDEKFKNHGEKREAEFTDESDNLRPKYLRNCPLWLLINGMRNMDKNLCVLDETGIKENVSIEFSAPLDDIVGLNRDLKKYDLEIARLVRKVPFILIRDKLPRID